MFVSVYCLDKQEDTKAKRLVHLQEHLTWVEANMDKIQVAGPLKEQETIVGSLYILRVESISQAQGLIESDPYFHADIWASIDFRTFSGVAGEWVGGKNW